MINVFYKISMKNNYKNTILTTQNLLILFISFIFLGSWNLWGQDATFTASGTWTAPAGVTCITVNAWGAGGGASGSNNTNSSGGGGGGAFSTASVKVVPGQTYTITVGTGGIGGAAGAFNPGGDGGFTEFKDGGTTKVKAAGGKGSTGNAGAAGALTSDNIPAGAGFKGGDGYKGRGSGTGGGGGGGGAGSAGAGSNSTSGAGGTGGTGSGGNGGTGNKDANGGNGTTYGGGGGGVSKSHKGGNGANGYLTITYSGSCPTDPIEIVSITTNPATICQDSVYQIVVTAKNNTGSAIASGATTYAIDYSFDNSTWTNNATYVNNIANGATKAYSFNMPSIATVGSKVVYIRVRKTADASIVSSGSTTAIVDYCPKGSDDCSSATTVNISGTLQGNTANYTTDNKSWVESNGYGSATIENNGWYKFVATSTSLTFTLCAGNCNNNSYGLQFAIFGLTTCGSGSLDEKFFHNQLTGNNCLTNQTVSGLTIGKTYYMMIDGYEGANCPYTLRFSSGIQLPVELVSFTGSCTADGSINFSWLTGSETNNDFFTLQQSTDGEEWHNIADIKGNGTVSTKTSYNYEDRTYYNQKINYFRLKQTDFDGKVNYHNPISVANCKANIHSFEVIPNPTNGIFSVLIENPEDVLSLSIYDITGNVVYQSQTVQAQQSINMNEQTKGVYIISIQKQDGSKEMKRLVKE